MRKLHELQTEAIPSIKSRIESMLLERQGAGQDREAPFVKPSDYWADFCSAFDYMLDLSEESFSKLRLHTYHLTGDNYQTYFFSDAKDEFLKSWEIMTDNLPDRYRVFEAPGGIGYPYEDGTLLSHDSVRWQSIIKRLFQERVLEALEGLAGRPVLLEIGAGYGGLAHHLSRILEPRPYVIVDLPETLLFSASYLSMLNPDKRIYVYDRNDFDEVLGAPEKWDFLLFPNYRLADLRSLDFDLAINVASFQEMREDQVIEYLDFVATHCAQLYSENQDAQPKNAEISSVSNLLRARFEAKEILADPPPAAVRVKRLIRKTIKKIAVAGRLMVPNAPGVPYRHYLCRSPRGKDVRP